MVDGIKSNQVRDVLLWKGSNLNLEKAIEICRVDEVTKKQLQLMLQEKEIGKINKKKTKFYQKKVDRDSKDPESTSDGQKDGKTRNADSVEEYTDQRCVQYMVKSAENAGRKIVGQGAVRARMLMKQNNM